MGLFSKIKSDFPELVQIVVRFSEPIRIPRVWKDLLELKVLPKSAFKAHGDVSINDPLPYCDDRREVVIRQGDISVYAILCSARDAKSTSARRNYQQDD